MTRAEVNFPDLLWILQWGQRLREPTLRHVGLEHVAGGTHTQMLPGELGVGLRGRLNPNSHHRKVTALRCGVLKSNNTSSITHSFLMVINTPSMSLERWSHSLRIFKRGCQDPFGKESFPSRGHLLRPALRGLWRGGT